METRVYLRGNDLVPDESPALVEDGVLDPVQGEPGHLPNEQGMGMTCKLSLLLRWTRLCAQSVYMYGFILGVF